RLRRLEAQQLREANDRAPDAAVRVDDDPRVRMRMCRDALEEREEVEGERHQVGEDDVVECLAERESLARGDLEAKLGMARARECDHAWADVDADARGRFQRCEQVP